MIDTEIEMHELLLAGIAYCTDARQFTQSAEPYRELATLPSKQILTKQKPLDTIQPCT